MILVLKSSVEDFIGIESAVCKKIAGIDQNRCS